MTETTSDAAARPQPLERARAWLRVRAARPEAPERRTNGTHRNGSGRNGSDRHASHGATPARQESLLTGHRLARFDLRSVAHFAVRFAACVLAMVLAGFVMLWVLASVFGLVDAFEEFMRDIGFTGFRLLSVELLLGTALVAATCAAAAASMTVVAAAIYNVLAVRSGGVRILVSTGHTTRATHVTEDPQEVGRHEAELDEAAAGNGARRKTVTTGGKDRAAPPPPRRGRSRPAGARRPGLS